MAETTTTSTTRTKSTPKKVTVRLPRNNGHNARQDEFFSANFQNYIIKRGETVEIPEILAGIIRDNEKSEDYAVQYVEEKALREPK